MVIMGATDRQNFSLNSLLKGGDENKLVHLKRKETSSGVMIPKKFL